VNIRLIKSDTASEARAQQPPDEVPVIDILRGWVREFKATKAKRARLDLEQLRDGEKA
jgi:hypothetical protein